MHFFMPFPMRPELRQAATRPPAFFSRRYHFAEQSLTLVLSKGKEKDFYH
jgi:hypothetical protein